MNRKIIDILMFLSIASIAITSTYGLLKSYLNPYVLLIIILIIGIKIYSSYKKKRLNREYEYMVELRKDYLELEFVDTFISRIDYFCMGYVKDKDKYFLSFPVFFSSQAEMSVYFEISEEEYRTFTHDIHKIYPLIKRCKKREEDHRLFDKHGNHDWKVDITAKKIDLRSVYNNKFEWDVNNKESAAYQLLEYISENEGMWLSPETIRTLFISNNPGIINDLFDSLVEAKLIYSDYIKPSPRDRGWFLTKKGRSIISNR